MTLGACFDSSHVHTRDMRFHNTEATGHAANVASDYAVLRDHGFTFFRDGAWLTHTFNGGNYNWDYLDQVAAESQGDVQLTICHYEWIKEPEFELFCFLLGERYKGVFHSYIPVCESGYWAQKMTEGWKRKYSNWWKAFRYASTLTWQGAKALKYADSSCKIAMAEPWFHSHDMDDRARPFNTLKGKYDIYAWGEGCLTFVHGNDYLLDIIGLNIYGQPNVRGLIEQAERMFPGKQIMITETSTMFSDSCIPGHIAYMERETAGTSCEVVCWSPVLPMARFEDGQRLESGFLFDMDRKRVY